MPRRTAAGRGDPIASEARPLPAAPSLEYERKEAKALLEQIHAGDADALGRVRAAHPVALRGRGPEALKLADAQHLIAREYGFASWPRLVEYFAELERQRNSPRHNSGNGNVDWYERSVYWLLEQHARGDRMVARELSHFVPRFFARPAAEILATPITEQEARLVVARRERRASWEELIERARASRQRMDAHKWEGSDVPWRRAREAILQHDREGLATLLDEHPELLTPSVVEREWRVGLARLALHAERKNPGPESRRVTELLASRGVDVQRELNELLLGWPFDEERLEALRWYLARGADPSWMPPNGIPVLEHALVRFRDADCVDLIAQRVTPRRALWIAAGLGDAAGVRSFVAAKGKLTPEGRRNRPDLLAMGAREGLLPDREADDLEIMWEAFLIAGWNGRWTAMDALLDAGLPVDHAPLGAPLLLLAVGDLNAPLVEFLLDRGADLDRVWEGWGKRSARSAARSMVGHLQNPHDEKVRRLLELCGAGTVEEILAEREASRPSPPPADERTMRVMRLAADDAARQGQATVTTENMLVGFLRVHGGVLGEGLAAAGTDMPKLRSAIGHRLLPDEDPLRGEALPADAGAQEALRVATAEADSRRRFAVDAHHLMYGILSVEAGPGARLLTRVGTDLAKLRERLNGFL